MRFGEAVRAALEEAKHDQSWLADQIGVRQPTVSSWLRAEFEPDREKVFAIEQVLNRKPGTFSRLLGYLPLDAVPAVTVLEAIDADPDLPKLAREILRDAYTAAKGTVDVSDRSRS